MTAEFELTMRLMGAASKGFPATPPDGNVNWETVFQLAEQQQILPLICHAIKAQSLHSCPNEFPLVLAYCARSGAVIALLDEMNAAGIPCCVVKGFSAGIHYAAPEYRLSGDTDIVVYPADEYRACAFLEQHGFSIRPRWEHGHHAIAVHPKMGIIEVHVQLYDELIGEVWFDGLDADSLLLEPKQQIQTPDGTYWTLGPTDHAIYMALHMVKHFILSGNSLRMMMDVALSIAGHRESVDLERFWRTIDALHYGTLIRNVLWSMVQYCGFSAEDFPGIGRFDSECVRLLLNDLETGGWLGRNEAEEREAGWHAYNRQLLRKQKNDWQYRLYMLNWGHSFHLSTLFPGKTQLARNYPVVLKCPVLIPFAWIHRIIFRGIPLLFSGAWTKPIIQDKDPLNTVSKARLALFHRLNMLE